ncbi:MAG: DUF86 domain-containing protein [Geitlerinemataceae cyanobacterium]
MNRDRQFLLDILQSADLIQTYTDGYTRAQFIADIQAQDSVIRRLLIVAEAARRLSPEMRDRLSEISWSEINGMRNRLVHEYDDIDLDIVWAVVRAEIPDLIRAIAPHVPPET